MEECPSAVLLNCSGSTNYSWLLLSKDQREKNGSYAQSHLARKRGFGLVSASNKGHRVLLAPKQRAIFFQLVFFLQQNSILKIQNLIRDGQSAVEIMSKE